MAIDQNDKRGLQRPGTAESDFNELQQTAFSKYCLARKYALVK